MPSTETGESAFSDAAVPEKPPPEGGGFLLVLIVVVGGALTVAWLGLVILLGSWLIRAVL